MKIENLEVINFRTHKNYKFKPNESLTIITGKNGSGKTSILESIYYCGFGKSFKENKEINLINDESKEMLIRCNLLSKNKNNNITIYLTENEKIINVNNTKIKRISELNKYLNILWFEPKLVSLFKDEPAKRRNYLDLLLSKQSSKYLENLKIYKKILQERNKALKEDSINLTLIKTYSAKLIECSKEINLIRQKFFNKINETLNEVSKKISNNSKGLKIYYQPIVELNSQYSINLSNLYKDNLSKDLEEKTTTIGIHKEDYLMLIDNKDISTYGSQGENRIAVISFVLSPYFILKSDYEKPIILLDDVLSELDKENKNKLLNLLKELNQVIITSTQIEKEYEEYEYKLIEGE